MTDTKALDALIEAVEKGTLAQRDEDEYVPAVPLPNGDTTNLANVFCAHNGSLDAAKALHEALLPGWAWLVRGTDEADIEYGDCTVEDRGFANVWHKVSPNEGGEHFPSFARTPARALLIATLKAYRASL